MEGTLVDKLPDGYLLRVDGKSQVVPYASVKSIAKVDPAAAPIAPSPAPVASPGPEPTPTSPPPAASPAPSIAPAPPPPGPPPPPPPLPPPSPRSPGLVVGGTLLVTTGVLGLIAGVILLPIGAAVASENTCHAASGDLSFDCEYGNASDMVTAGAVSLVVGGVLVAGGIPMLAVGSRPASREGVPSARASVRVGPRGASARWTF